MCGAAVGASPANAAGTQFYNTTPWADQGDSYSADLPYAEQAPEYLYEYLSGVDPFGDVLSGLVAGGDGGSIADYFSMSADAGIIPTAGQIAADAGASFGFGGGLDVTLAAGLPVDWEIAVPVIGGQVLNWGLNFAFSSLLPTETEGITPSDVDVGWHDGGVSGFDNGDSFFTVDEHGWSPMEEMYRETGSPGSDMDALTFDSAGERSAAWAFQNLDDCFDPADNTATCTGDYAAGTDVDDNTYAAQAWAYEMVNSASGGALVSMPSNVDGVRYCGSEGSDGSGVDGDYDCGLYAREAPSLGSVMYGDALSSATVSTSPASGAKVVIPDTGCEDPTYGACVGATSVTEAESGADSATIQTTLGDKEGTDTTTLPDCSGMTWDQCVQTLRNAGILGWIYPADPADDQLDPTDSRVGTVQQTDPSSATRVWPATSVYVDMYTSTATEAPPVSSPTDTGNGTDTGSSDGTTGSTGSCGSVAVPALDLSPLESLAVGSKFPFGIFSWIATGITGWEGDTTAPSFNVPLLGEGVGHPVNVNLSILDPEMPTIRGILLIAFTVLSFYWLATGTLGFGGGGGSDD